MNILFWLTPKDKVAFITDNQTVRQALNKMEIYRYTTIPILDKEGHYVGTISEGDLLWYIKNSAFDYDKIIKDKVKDIPRRKDNQKMTVQTEMEDILTVASNQNFIPVVDDFDFFIGIITRKSIIEYILKTRKT